jgi:hypothetical protein
MQTKVLKRFKAAVEEAGLDPVQNTAWANTGTVLAQDDDFNTRLKLVYDFQTSYCSLHLSGPSVEALSPTDSDSRDYRVMDPGKVSYYHLEYTNAPRLRGFFALVARALGKVPA